MVSILGIGDDGLDGATEAVRQLILEADLLVGQRARAGARAEDAAPSG